MTVPTEQPPAAPAPPARPDTPSIQMLRPHLNDLPPLDPAIAALPARYAFRTYLPGDEAGWAALMNTGQMDTWDVARTREKLTGRPWPQFDPDGLFIITHDRAGPHRLGSQIVGSACAWVVDPADTATGTLHMVCVLPEHRGAGLSYSLCLAVLHRFKQRGFRHVRLNTGDWRLGAVKIYLRLGFQPLYRKPTHPQQWQSVLTTLRWTAPITPIVEETT